MTRAGTDVLGRLGREREGNEGEGCAANNSTGMGEGVRRATRATRVSERARCGVERRGLGWLVCGSVSIPCRPRRLVPFSRQKWESATANEMRTFDTPPFRPELPTGASVITPLLKGSVHTLLGTTKSGRISAERAHFSPTRACSSAFRPCVPFRTDGYRMRGANRLSDPTSSAKP